MTDGQWTMDDAVEPDGQNSVIIHPERMRRGTFYHARAHGRFRLFRLTVANYLEVWQIGSDGTPYRTVRRKLLSTSVSTADPPATTPQPNGRKQA